MKRNPFFWIGRNARSSQFVVKQSPQGSLVHSVSSDLSSLDYKIVQQEFLRQACWSFNLAILLTAVSSLVSIIGIVMLLSGKVTEGTVTTAGGAASYIVRANCLRLAEKANARLSEILEEGTVHKQ
jgi:hypothetical protein